MARYSKEHIQQTRQKILGTATQLFKTEGIDTVGIARLMGKTGLTHGGFYAHFDSKDALVGQSLTAALAGTMGALIETARNDGTGLQGLVRSYTSRTHRDQPDAGCVLPSLAGEVARQSDGVRAPLTATLRQLIDDLGELSAQTDAAGRREEVLATLAAVVGAVALARAVNDPVLSDDILASVRRERLAHLQSQEDRPAVDTAPVAGTTAD